ncbi:Uncharacterised protein [uncultured archaeon]|nr:Uncharacterised protein [uncultured archaeon]
MLSNDLRLALDAVAFAREALGFEPDPWQANVLRWNGKRLLLNCCRQSGKSSTAAVLALHRALYHPGSLILVVSPSLRQSGELFRKVTDFLSNIKLEQQPLLKEDNRLSLTLDNNSRIVSLPSTETTVRGFSGASLIIEDEASRVPDELYYAVRPMLAVSGGRLILMSTPFGKRGHFFHEFVEGGEGWERISIPASECPRISQDFLKEEQATMPDFFFRAEYLCEFTETVDQVFSYEQVQGALSDDIEPLQF